MAEKESQCKTFRELLLEKENEIQEMGCLLEQSSEGSEVITDMKQKLFKVLEAVGQEVSEEESYDELLGRINNLHIITNGATSEESNNVADNDFLEKEKLLKVTKKLKEECILLREKLADTESRLQTEDNKSSSHSSSESNSISSDKLHLHEEELHQMKINYESLMKEKEDCIAELNEVKDKVESQEAEMKLLKDRNIAAETDQEQKLTEVLNKNFQLEKSLSETDSKFKTQEVEIESLKREIVTLTSSLDTATQQNGLIKSLRFCLRVFLDF